MIFRSHSEVRIAKTLDHRGIFFIPPTRVRLSAAKDSRQSRELDFVICHEGKWGVLEVDGPFHDRKLDAERDGWLRRHGITSIQRFPAEKCYNTPHAVIDEFLHALEYS
jgi:very-short-patch-repair endonuclease